MSDLPSNSKPFYKRPENITGLLIAAAAIYGGVYLLPYVIIAAQNTLYAGLLLGALAGITYAVLDKDIRTTAFYAWKMFTRKITGFVINMDPIAVVETYLKKMAERLEEMLESKNALGGQIKKLDMVINDNTVKATQSLKLAQQAEKQGDQMSKASFAIQAQTLKNSNDALSQTKAKMDLMFNVLDRMYKNTDYILKNTRMQVDIKKKERDAIMAGHRAMSSGWKVIKGDSEQKQMFDAAMENIADTMGRQLSEMEQIMDTSSMMMNGVDLEKGMIKEDALKMLENWEKQGQSVLLGTQKNVLLSQANNAEFDVTPKREPVTLVTSSKDRFSKIIKNK